MSFDLGDFESGTSAPRYSWLRHLAVGAVVAGVGLGRRAVPGPPFPVSLARALNLLAKNNTKN